MESAPDISPLTLNRLSVYLRCLRILRNEGKQSISSRGLARRFELSPSQIRKDLANFGEFGVRGVGYEVASLADHLHQLLRLDECHNLLIVGVGNLGSALCSYLGFNDTSFRVVAGVDSDPERIGKQIGDLRIQALEFLERIVDQEQIDIGVLAIPPEAAVRSYERLVQAGLRSILNFAAVQLPHRPSVRVKNVDFRLYLEELAFFAH